MTKVKGKTPAFKKEKRGNLVDQINDKKYKKERATKEKKIIESGVDEKLSKKILRQAEDLKNEVEPNLSEEEVVFDEEETEEILKEHENFISRLAPEDEKILDKFMPENGTTLNLADMILSKINAMEAFELENGETKQVPAGLDPKVIQVYTKVGLLLSRYKSGKIPKAFKIIPTLKNWEDIIYLTEPVNWTPNATFQATRIFSSNMNPTTAKIFYEFVLLDHVRRDIKENKKLNCHLYAALKKSVYKPSAFFKGLIFPLCLSNCTLREALIVGSVLAKTSIPVLQSSAAILKITQFPTTGATCLFL